VSATVAALGADTLDGLRLNRALKAGILRLLSRQEHLNKINVFPVPDGDTGTNLALTMSAVLGVLQKSPDPHAGKTLTRIADAALDGARGNSGAILAQFFLGLCDKLGHLGRLSPDDFADGVHGGAAYARESMSEPREGTILTVLTDFAHEIHDEGAATQCQYDQEWPGRVGWVGGSKREVDADADHRQPRNQGFPGEVRARDDGRTGGGHGECLSMARKVGRRGL